MITNTKKKSETSTHPGNRRQLWLVAAAVVLAIPLLIVWWPAWRQYPPVTSPESLQAMKLLYTACNTKDPVRLKQVEKQVQKLDQEKKLAPAEQAAYAKILALANAGEWESAQKAAFKFAQDQVGVGHAAPKGHSHDHSSSSGTHRHAK